MTALAIERKTPKLGQDTIPSFPTNLPLPIAASTKLYTGAMVALATTGTNAGNVVQGQTATGLVALGVAEQTFDNSAGAAGALTMVPRQGVFLMNVGGGVDAISATNVGQDCYMIDDNTVGLTNGGGTRSRAGVIVAVDSGTPPFFQPTGAWVLIGLTGPIPEFALEDVLLAGKARNVVTSLAAYTGSGTNVLTASANGAWAAQDGVTNSVGDVVFFQGGTTNLTAALDSGPWQLTSLGGAAAKWTAQRPSWFQTGAAVPNGFVVEVDGEGTLWAGTSWKAFCAQGTVIGTTDPAFYVGRVTQVVTLASSTFTVSNVGIKSATKSQIACSLNTAGGTLTSTVGYGVIAAPTPGYIGTASAVVDAIASGMTKNGTADTSQVNVTVINW